MRELNRKQLDQVNGGVLGTVLSGALVTLGYIGALGTAQSFGRGLGIGFYDATHNDD